MTDITTKIYTRTRVAYGPNLIVNPSFEDVTGDDFDNWTEFGTCEDEGTVVQDGDHAVKIAGNGGIWCDNITVEAGEKYRFSYHTYGSGNLSVLYAIWDETNNTDIIPYAYSGYTDAEWNKFETHFIVPAGCVELNVIFWLGYETANVYVDNSSLNLQLLDTAWEENVDVLAKPAPVFGGGIQGTGPADLVASSGEAVFYLDNGLSNSQGKIGLYSPDHDNVIGGYEEGQPVKIIIDGPTVEPLWIQIADFEEDDLSDFDGVVPAWCAEIREQADFDAQFDAHGHMNDNAGYGHDGVTAISFTFADNIAMYGQIDCIAINQTSAVFGFYFNPSDFNLDDGKVIYLWQAMDGSPTFTYLGEITSSGGVYTYNFYTWDDARDLKTVASRVVLIDGWHRYTHFWRRATAPDANDGFAALLVDDNLIGMMDDLDNDTVDYDLINLGNTFSNSVGFGGHYWFDTIKLGTVGALCASELAAINGDIGLCIPIMDTTSRYAAFTDPNDETAITAESYIDPSFLTMPNGTDLTFIWLLDADLAETPGYASLKKVGADYKIYATIRNDAGALTDTAEYTITEASHDIKIEWSVDGYLKLYIDDVLKETLSGIDNDTWRVDAIYYGAVYIDTGIYGILYMDGCKWGGIGRTKFTGVISRIEPYAGVYGKDMVEVYCHDWMGYLIKQELGTHAVQDNIRANEAITTVLTEFPIQPEDTRFDVGIEEFDSVFQTDDANDSMARFFQKMCRNEQGRIFVEGDGTLVFDNRNSRALTTESAFTINGVMTELDAVYDSKHIYNIVSMTIEQEDVAPTANVLLWSLENPMLLAPQQSIPLTCPYTDPNTSRYASAIDVVTPVTYQFGTLANPDAYHSYFSQQNTVGGNTLVSIIKNNHPSEALFLSLFDIYGKTITTYNKITLTAIDQDSIDSGIGERRFEQRLEHITDVNKGYGYATLIAKNYGAGHIDTCRIVVLANTSDALAKGLIEAEVSTRFTAIEAQTGISRDFYVNHISYKQDDTLLWAIISAQASNVSSAWIWDKSHWDSVEDGRWQI